MNDLFDPPSPESWLGRLLFLQPFDRLLNSDASPEACAENLKQIAQPREGYRRDYRTVEIFPANAETVHFEIRHKVYQRRGRDYSLVKVDGALRKDPETSRTRATGTLSIDPTNLATFVVVAVFVLIAIIEPFFRIMFIVGIGFCLYQAYRIRAAYLDLRAKLFDVLEHS